MTAVAASARADIRVIGLVGVAHGLSHFFQLVLPPLFPFIKAEFGVSYAALGGAMAAYYAVSGICQTGAGFVVDRVGGRAVLLAGLALIAGAALLAGIAPSFGWLVVAAVLGGLGNSVFHPADLALLNAKVAAPRLGYAFSAHALGGSFGYVLAPMLLVPIASAYGWRAATIVAGSIGLVLLAVIATQRVLAGSPAAPAHAGPHAKLTAAETARMFGSAQILLCFTFFFLYAVALVAFQTFAATAATHLYGVSLLTASSGLTGFLFGGAAGILAGGYIASRARRHNVVAGLGMVLATGLALVIASGALPGGLLVAAMTLTGFANGMIGPSRDIIVRAVAPAEARGRVYGFVYSGLDLGALLAPLLFGLALDLGRPEWVFGGAALFTLLAVPTIIQVRDSGGGAARAAARA